jgi:L-seryl-tRNA(Ser) seleniumtransferase/D-glucosaminate-6-phosphate ammonia-lyase
VINAAGKLTALGGTAQTTAVADAQAAAAQAHVDLDELRAAAGRRLAELTGAQAATITCGAAAGIATSVAALISGGKPDLVARLPDSNGLPNRVLLQVGHDVNFGAPVVQMIRLGGGVAELVGSAAQVTIDDLEAALAEPADLAGFVYVQSHHVVLPDRLSLERCIKVCGNADLPVVVDAAAEEDLGQYVALGADLVTYSGGKAIGGPTVGFIAGRTELIAACEAQQRGIARAMKVGKEQIAGLMAALDAYDPADHAAERALAGELIAMLGELPGTNVYEKPDEAGRDIVRVAIERRGDAWEPKELIAHLVAGHPSIRTRNHQAPQGRILIDCREIDRGQATQIAARVREFFSV